MTRRAVMVCATRQHIGKTSVSMALIDALRRKIGAGGKPARVGYYKPIGQKWVRLRRGRGR